MMTVPIESLYAFRPDEPIESTVTWQKTYRLLREADRNLETATEIACQTERRISRSKIASAIIGWTGFDEAAVESWAIDHRGDTRRPTNLSLAIPLYQKLSTVRSQAVGRGLSISYARLVSGALQNPDLKDTETISSVIQWYRQATVEEALRGHAG